MTLDNPVLAGRLRAYDRRSTYERRAPMSVRGRVMSDIIPATQSPKPTASRPARVRPPVATPARRTSRSKVLKREIVKQKKSFFKRRRKVFTQGRVIMAFAILLFMFGATVGVMGLRTNHKVEAQVQQLAKPQGNGGQSDVAFGDTPPAETKPTGNLANYHVTPTLPRILSIPKLGVQARVLRVGVNDRNELGTPSNIFDTAWYEGSSKPGEAGAVLIDGHVSGPTQHGVFYDLKKLKKGDKISIEIGSGKTLTYSVVTTKVYDANNVDMAAAVTPITPGKPGLNLMTCTGKLDSGGTHFQQRLVVFASQD